MDLEIVKFIQSGANEFFDVFFSLITRFGEEIFFVCLFLIFYWVVSYNYAFKFALFYLTSVLINNVLKIIVKRPRPWMASDLVDNKLPATGMSFPSGHSQGIACISTFIVYDCYKYKPFKKGVNITILVSLIVLSLLVGFSRIYLGQHYLTDVIAGLVLGVLVILLVNFIYSKISNKFKSKFNLEATLAFLSHVLMVAVVVVSLTDFVSYETALKVFKYAGMLIGTTLGYMLSKRLVEEINGTMLAKLFKVIVGLIVVFGLIILFGLIPETQFVVGMSVLVVAFVATFVYPYVFSLIYKKIKKA